MQEYLQTSRTIEETKKINEEIIEREIEGDRDEGGEEEEL